MRQLGGMAVEANEVAVLIGLAVLLIFALPSIYGQFFEKGNLHFTVIQRHRDKLRAEALRRGRPEGVIRQSRGILAIIWRVTPLLPNQVFYETKRKLRQAGFSSDWMYQLFVCAKVFSVIIFIVCMIAFFLTYGESESVRDVSSVGVVAALLVFFGCDILIAFRKKKRLRRLGQSLPDCLDLLVICAEAGLSLDGSLKRVAEEFVEAVPELSEELLLTSVELNFLPDRRQALFNLSSRVDLPAFRGVTTALIQTEKYGTPLAQALRTLSADLRESRLLEAEEKAARLPAILTVPMICFILPALFIVLAGPAVISVMKKMG